MFLAILIITAAVISSLFRALTPWAKQYKGEVEQHLSLLLGGPVTINTMETGWYWFEPVIKLNQVSISDGDQKVVKLSKLLMGINLFSSFWHWQIQPGVLFIEDLHLRLHQTDDQWQIDGLDDKQNMTWDLASYQPILVWVLAQQKIIIKNLSLHIYMQDGNIIPLSGLNLSIVNHAGRYKIKGRGYLAQSVTTTIQLLANLTLNPYALHKASGHVFFSVQHLLPAQWQGFTSQSRFNLLGGKGNVELWADIAKGTLANVQSRLGFHKLAWFDKQTQKEQLVQAIKANLAWIPTKEGWQLAGDHIRLHLGGTRWPENNLMLRYQKDKQSYFVFIKNVLIESLLSTNVVWPESLNKVLAMKPHGQLHDTQVQINAQGFDYILTRFSALGWQADETKPGLENLSGAFFWKPKEGSLQLDGEKIVLKPKELPPITLLTLNAAIDWKELSDGIRINMERLVLNHPNLLLNAHGVLDKISDNSPGQLQMSAEFAVNEGQYWLNYLPSKYLKPKLEAWLKNDVKRIEKASGEIAVKGPLADFPFDRQPGEFTIKSHLTGVDLVFAHNWPLTKNIEGYLRVDKRNLEADIVHANLKGVIVDKGNLRVNDVGLDREVLLVHSKIEAKANKALAYILSSPLQKKLSALNMLKMQGLLDLDLQLEAPLYPENDNVLALGDINFKNIRVDVHHSMDDITLKKLNGSLQFDQEGVLDSNINTLLLNSPTKLIIQSVHNPYPYTQVKITGETSVERLNKKLNLPLLSLMQGSLWLESELRLTDDPNDLDHLRIRSSMLGLNIDLPPPFGKTAKTKTPLTVDVDFNPQKAVRLRFNYDNRLSSDLLFSGSKADFELQKGEIRLGSGDAQESKQRGVQVIGSLPYFDLQQWLAIQAKLPGVSGKSTLIDVINRVDIKLHETKFWKQKYNELIFKAVKLAGGKWSIQLNQATLAANLRYQPATNTLTGQFDKLRIEKTKAAAKPLDLGNSTLKPTDIPNLDLGISSFQYGDLDLGNVSLKTTSSTKRWQLDYCKINAASYQLTAKGEWQQKGKVNSTKLRADLHINDLAKSLQSWKISPAVEAQQGDIQFIGGWSGALLDFHLTKVTGQMAISFKNGRITNLSPETEEKLGLGKLLSILSLQTIPRRLKLDFSDLSKAGYSFDQFKGNFDVVNGVMTTKNSYIDGPVAYASMKGNLDIAKQLYDVDLKISPHITASLPVVATIAGGPIVGFATWVASRIINQGMQKISGYTYKVSGPWGQPMVEQTRIIRKRLTPPIMNNEIAMNYQG